MFYELELMSSETCDGGGGGEGGGLNKRPKKKRRWLRRKENLWEPKNARMAVSQIRLVAEFLTPIPPLGLHWEKEVLRQQVVDPRHTLTFCHYKQIALSTPTLSTYGSLCLVFVTHFTP